MQYTAVMGRRVGYATKLKTNRHSEFLNPGSLAEQSALSRHPDGAAGCFKAVNAINFSAALAGGEQLALGVSS